MKRVNIFLRYMILWCVLIVAIAYRYDTEASEKESEGIAVVLPNCSENPENYFDSGCMELYVTVDNPFEELYSGFFSVQVCIPDNYLPDGVYYIDVNVRLSEDGQIAGRDGGEIVVTNGIATVMRGGDTYFSAMFREKGMTYWLLRAEYYSDEPIVKDKLIYKITSRTSSTSSGNHIFFSDFSVMDTISGYSKLDYDAELVYAEKVNLKDFSRKTWKYSIEKIGREIYLINRQAEMYVGSTLKLTAGSDLYQGQKYSFSSSDKSVAKISASGKITALKAGKTTITVKDKANNKKISWVLTVNTPFMSLVVEKNRIMSGMIYTYKMIANGYKSGTITWNSSNEQVGTIDEKTGTFTAVQPGKTVITAYDSAGYSYRFTVEVYDEGNADIAKYIIMHYNEEAGSELQSLLYEHLMKVYKKVYAMFGDGTYHYIDVYFEHIDWGGVAAYAMLGYSPDHNEIHIGIETMTNNIDDVDCATHELIHTAQNYPFATKYGEDRAWLGEGLTDYGRYLLGVQNEKAGWSLGKYREGQHYTDSYGVTASFIKYVVDVHNAAFAQDLNEAFRNRTYTEQLWKDETGYTIDQLWEMYKNY